MHLGCRVMHNTSANVVSPQIPANALTQGPGPEFKALSKLGREQHDHTRHLHDLDGDQALLRSKAAGQVCAFPQLQTLDCKLSYCAICVV